MRIGGGTWNVHQGQHRLGGLLQAGTEIFHGIGWVETSRYATDVGCPPTDVWPRGTPTTFRGHTRPPAGRAPERTRRLVSVSVNDCRGGGVRWDGPRWDTLTR
ncbi:hypothetical protein GCM10009802_37100 [Streptomyces synnematoformans]|uniref:Uncharacterized protein n=1 Tax=Streptomyces synnematoformans TaxID=415721 RepID=A0ABN2YM67_9ACTN